MSADTINVAAQYLTFKLKEEVFAIEISKVREVLEYTTLTKVPRTPDFMSGVINLRGNVVPVIDLNLKLGMPKLRGLLTPVSSSWRSQYLVKQYFSEPW